MPISANVLTEDPAIVPVNRPRRLDTRSGTIYLMVPKMRQGGYIPFFVNAYKRSEAAPVQVIQEAYVNGESIRKIERLNREIRRHTSVMGLFPDESYYVRLVTTCLMEYAEDWTKTRAYIQEEPMSVLLPKDAA